MATKRDKATKIQQATFTGRKSELSRLRSLIPLDRVEDIDILFIYGIGGIGKSTLLDQFYNDLKKIDIPVAHIDLQDHLTIYEFLNKIYSELSSYIQFPLFEGGIHRHGEIEKGIISKGIIPNHIFRYLIRIARGALSVIPSFGISAINEVISAEEMESYIGKIYNLVGRKDGDFWMNPEDDLTNYMIEDINIYCIKQRMVIIIDTYERIGNLDYWLREKFFANIGENAFFVIAGRKKLESKKWQDFIGLIDQYELKSFNQDEAIEYLSKKSNLDIDSIKSMVDYSDGHPLTLSLLAEMSEHLGGYQLDLSLKRRDVITRLLDIFIQNIASTVREALNICAILRIIDQDKLEYMLNLSDAQYIFDEIQLFDFIKIRNDGIILHDTVWKALNDQIRWRSSTEYQDLNKKAALYYEMILNQVKIHERDKILIEHLYHLTCVNEYDGIKLFRQMAEEYISYWAVNKLQRLINEINTYSLENDNSWMWRDYYQARLAQLETRFDEAESIYQMIADKEQADPILRAYAFCDLGSIFSTAERLNKGEHRAIYAAQESLKLAQEKDFKIINNYYTLSRVYKHIGNWAMSMSNLEKIKNFAEESKDQYMIASVYYMIQELYFQKTIWFKGMEARRNGLNMLSEDITISGIKSALLGNWYGGLIWMGRYREAEQSLREALPIEEKIIGKQGVYFAGFLGDLGLCLGMQYRYKESLKYLSEAYNIQKKFIVSLEIQIARTMNILGIIFIRMKNIKIAKNYLIRALNIKEKYNDNFGIPEISIWLGQIYEFENKWDLAIEEYNRILKLKTGRIYFECGAQIGIVRVLYKKGYFNDFMDRVNKIIEIAKSYNYNDHLAYINLMIGNFLLDGFIQELDVIDDVLNYYKNAIIYSLKHNCFLLDEIIWNDKIFMPLKNIFNNCLDNSLYGKDLLFNLREWWKSAIIDTDELPLGITLTKFEHLIRDREIYSEIKNHSIAEKIDNIINQK